jgi:hypothetical protein
MFGTFEQGGVFIVPQHNKDLFLLKGPERQA